MLSLRSGLQGIFLFFTILLAMLVWKGNAVLSIAQIQLILKILMPAYLIIAGVMMGMFLHTIFSHVAYHHSDAMTHHDRMLMEKDVSSGLFLGLMIGVVLALLYISKIS